MSSTLDFAIHCRSFDECKNRIQDDFGINLIDNQTSRKLMIRGENDIYPRTESSMKRFLTIDENVMRKFDEASPFIDFEDRFSEFHEGDGLKKEEAVGFLQHYGFPTDLFDLSPSIDNARFFACDGQESKPVGLIGVFPRDGVADHFELTDLSNHPFALRPQRQIAYVARPPRGVHDLKSEACSSITGSRWYSFDKSQEDIRFAKDNVALTYPSEIELAHLFSREFVTYFQDHWSYDEESAAGKFVLDELNKITEYLYRS